MDNLEERIDTIVFCIRTSLNLNKDQEEEVRAVLKEVLYS